MAQIEQNDGGKKKKGAQKKMHIHVDFTPMVDMNMLLITFFMLCTTMIKSQTLQIALPAPVDPNAPQEQQMGDEVKESQALTMIVDTQRDQDGNIMRDAEGNQLNIVYYYEGFEPKIEANGAIEDKLKAEAFIPNSKDGMTRGIRNILYEKNKTVVDSLKRYKIDFANEKITKEEYDSIAKIIRNNNKNESPKVSIKAADNASWESVIAALDEMQINQISQYRIAGMTHNDTLIIEDYNQRNPKK